MTRLVTALVVVALLGACGGDDDKGAAPTTTTPTTEAPPGTDGTSTTAPTTTSTSATGACGDLEAAPDATERTEATADVDGDRRADQLESFRIDGGTRPRYRVQVALAAGGGAFVDVEGDESSPVAVLGGFDVDGEGGDEVWARVGSGASAAIVGLFQLQGCSLRTVALPSGEDLQLPVGGTVGTASGVECGDRGAVEEHLLVHTARNADDHYELYTTGYRIQEGLLVETELGETASTITSDEVADYARLRCGDVAL